MHMCVLVFLAPVQRKKEAAWQRLCRGSPAKKTVMPWLKMMKCLYLIADSCVVDVLSQDLEMMAHSFGDLRVLLVVLGCFLFFRFFIHVLRSACTGQRLCIIFPAKKRLCIIL